MKCLPASKLPLAQGNVLHDWHAEVLAIRAFNGFVLSECDRIMSTSDKSESESSLVRLRQPEPVDTQEHQPFEFLRDVKIHMYCSEAPCGDASMELVMDAQEDATPWTSAPPMISAPLESTEKEPKFEDHEFLDRKSPIENDATALRGRSNFSLLGVVRCKPSRPDAPPTLSKSCTDKLTLKQATSLLSSPVSLLVSPRLAYLDSLILPASQYVPSACSRGFSRSGRLAGLNDSKWQDSYRFQEFKVRPTTREFTWNKRSVHPGTKAVASNISAVWTPAWHEILIGGVLQGKKQFNPLGASRISRRRMWELSMRIAGNVLVNMRRHFVVGDGSYGDMKGSEALAERRKVKRDIQKALKGWAPNRGDDDFRLSEP